MAVDEENVLAYTDIRFQMQDIVDVIKDAVESAFGMPAQQANFIERGDYGAIEVEFNFDNPSSWPLKNLPFKVQILCESVINSLINEVLLEAGQKGNLEAQPGNIWITEDEIGFALTSIKQKNNG